MPVDDCAGLSSGTYTQGVHQSETLLIIYKGQAEHFQKQ